jgi:lysine decarboxylase
LKTGGDAARQSGKRLIQRSIERALDFRKEVQRLREESDGWFFDIWQPEEVDEASAGR